MKRKAFCICLSICLACLSMAFLETVVRPGYVLKSAGKLALFLGTVWYFGGARGLVRREGLGVALALGAGIFGVILGAFFLFRPWLDLSVIMVWMKLEPIMQSEVSQKEKHQYSIRFRP